MGALRSGGYAFFSRPVPESLNAAAHRVIVDTLTARGWEVDDCDLYEEGFNPVLPREERRNYYDVSLNTLPLQSYVDRVCAADAIVFSFPVWNFGLPAMLKGGFYRVRLPGVVFHLRDGKPIPCLDDIKKTAADCTDDATRFRAMAVGDPPRKLFKRVVWGMARRDKNRYIARYEMKNTTPAQCEAFLARVKSEMEAF